MKIWERATTAGGRSSVGKYSKIHLLNQNKQVQLYCNAEELHFYNPGRIQRMR